MAGVHRPAVSEARDAVGAVWRIESARIVGALARYTGDFALAEDVAQEALAEALVTWPRDGVPRNPAGVADDGRAAAGDRRLPAPRRPRRAVRRPRPRPGRGRRRVGGAAAAADPRAADDLLCDPDRIDDDVLALVFISCHPLLSPEARVALTLRVVGGLTSDEIARAFLVPTATVQARITRAKKTLSAAQVPFEVPPPEERRERLGSVLSVVYVIFTEGSTATSGDDLIRPDLAHEAIRLARILARLVPDEPEVARPPRAARADRRPVPGPHRTRRRAGAAGGPGPAALGPWPRSDAAAPRSPGPAGSGRGLGAYGLQAAIAECHAVAPSVEETDWDRIVVLYEALGRLAPSPVVELNRAVALSMAQGPAAALRVVDDLVAGGQLAGSHLLPSVRGELLTRLGRTEEARSELERAVELCGNARERAVLERKIRDLG